MRSLASTTLALCLVWPGVSLADEREWLFRVFLDDREIGRHEFVLRSDGETERMETRADFKYRLLFLTLYEYEHRNTEVWRDGCLARIESRTDANGQTYQVQGKLEDGSLVLEAGAEASSLPGCVMSFAYWRQDFLGQRRLLNAQNGEWLPVEVSAPVQDRIEVRGERIEARRFELRAGEIRIRLWYSDDGEWLALESDARGGRILRYELI